MIPLGKYLDDGRLHRLCQVILNCQELNFLEDTATPVLQTDASTMVTNVMVTFTW